MAAGDSKVFRDFKLKQAQGVYAQGDAWRLAFVSNAYSTISADATNPSISSVGVVSGGNVASSYLLGSVAFTRSGGTITMDASDIATITKNASNPSTVRSAVIYNDTSASDDLVQAFDLSSDDSTPLDLVNNDLAFTFGASGLNTATEA